MEYCIYILYNPETRRFYTGLTNNIERRIKDHQIRHGKHLVLVHCEFCRTRKEARKLEKFFKSGYGREVRNEIMEALV